MHQRRSGPLPIRLADRIPLIFVFAILMSGVGYSASNGIWPSFYGEMFSTRVRLSGLAIGGHRSGSRDLGEALPERARPMPFAAPARVVQA
jgi:hypothetical protein